MSRVPKISDAEWEVMRVFWSTSDQRPAAAGDDHGQPASPPGDDWAGLSAADVLDQLDQTGWKPTTVKTMISRLVKKGALGFEESGRGYSYYPRVSRDECVRAESRSFVDRVYGGALQPMLVRFIREGKLTPAELGELRQILDEKVK